MKTISLQIPAILENIRIIESFIDNLKEEYNINDIYGNILVAVTEAVNNAIKHGSKENKDKIVEIKLILLNDSINFRIKNEGEGFDFKNLPDPLSEEFLEQEGGRGIFLMKQLTDEIHFYEKGKEVELIFYKENISNDRNI